MGLSELGSGLLIISAVTGSLVKIRILGNLFNFSWLLWIWHGSKSDPDLLCVMLLMVINR